MSKVLWSFNIYEGYKNLLYITFAILNLEMHQQYLQWLTNKIAMTLNIHTRIQTKFLADTTYIEWIKFKTKIIIELVINPDTSYHYSPTYVVIHKISLLSIFR